MKRDFITLREYITVHPDSPRPTLVPALAEMLRFHVSEFTAGTIIGDLAKTYTFSSYVDEFTAQSVLENGRIPQDRVASDEFWNDFEGFCSALLNYFASEEGRKKKSHAPEGSTLGKITSGTNPLIWETTARKRRKGRRHPY